MLSFANRVQLSSISDVNISISDSLSRLICAADLAKSPVNMPIFLLLNACSICSQSASFSLDKDLSGERYIAFLPKVKVYEANISIIVVLPDAVGEVITTFLSVATYSSIPD